MTDTGKTGDGGAQADGREAVADIADAVAGLAAGAERLRIRFAKGEMDDAIRDYQEAAMRLRAVRRLPLRAMVALDVIQAALAGRIWIGKDVLARDVVDFAVDVADRVLALPAAPGGDA